MSGPKTYFLTGSDTGAGKTTVAAAILAAATRRGLRAAAFKPIESGCRTVDGAPRPADAERLRVAAGGHQPIDEVCLFALSHPLAPQWAADLEGRSLDLDAITSAAGRLVDRDLHIIIIEGAGGLLVPLTATRRVIDLAVDLGQPLLIAARAGLGTINHTSLMIEAARARGLRIAGVLLGQVEGPLAADLVSRTRASIERWAGVPVLGCLPHLPRASLDELAAAAERHLDLAALF